MRIALHTSKIERKMGGATISTLQTMEVLVGFGHEAVVIAEEAEQDEVYGIPVYEETKSSRINQFYSWADVVFVMRRPPRKHILEYEQWHVPRGAHPFYSVYFAHNMMQPYKHGYSDGDVDLVVFNAEWVRKETGWPGDSFVLHPTIFKEKYIVEPGDRITQINLARKKGGEFFWEIAKALPDQQFLAVLGKEKDQVIPESLPANVEITEYQSDIKTIYARTRILLMPSQGYYGQHRWTKQLSAESYGRVAVEAASSGIPVIAYPAPGIKEALGDEGIFCDMEVDHWVHEIRRLSDQKIYGEVSKAVKVVGERLTPLEDIKRLEEVILTKSREKSHSNIPKQARVTTLPAKKIKWRKKYKILAPIMKTLQKIKNKGRKILKKVRNIVNQCIKDLGNFLAWMILSVVGKLAPRDKKRIIVMAPENGSFTDNAKYAYLWLEEEEFNVIYITYDKTTRNMLIQEGIRAEAFPSLSSMIHLLRGYIVIGVATVPFRRVRGHLTSGAKLIQLWHGAGVKNVLLGHEKFRPSNWTFRKKMRWLFHRAHPTYDILYFPSESLLNKRRDWFKYKEAKINGFVRNDILFGKKFGPKEDVFTDHIVAKQTRELKERGKKLVLYAPTFRKRNKPTLGYQIPFDFILMNEIMKDNNGYLIIKLHPWMREMIDFNAFDRILVYDQDKDIYPIMRLFDCLVTDYSSISSDFALLKRPIIRYFPDYDKEIGSNRVSKNMVDKMPGPLFQKFNDFTDYLESILNGSIPAQEDHSSETVFHDYTNNNFSGEKLVNDIRQLLTSKNR